MRKKFLFIVVIIVNSLDVSSQTIMNIYQSDGNLLQIPLNSIDSITYTNVDPGNFATIITSPVSNFTGTTAVCGGNITDEGGSIITQRGVCFSVSPSPTTANIKVEGGSGAGSFISLLSGLSANTSYYLRSYAINSAGTAYGNEVLFTTNSEGMLSNPGTGVFFDGYPYATILLGNGQEWMAENLRTTIYANGDTIPNVTDGVQWDSLNTGAWAHYNNDNQYENPYGKLYNYYTIVDSRNVCPTGWHIPTDAEWSFLINYIDPSSNGGNNVDTAGGKMKSTGIQYWQDPNDSATNETGFSGVPGGFRYNHGMFTAINGYGYWWSSTEFNPDSAWDRSLRYNDANVDVQVFSKDFGISVRCLKN